MKWGMHEHTARQTTSPNRCPLRSLTNSHRMQSSCRVKGCSCRTSRVLAMDCGAAMEKPTP